jgi:hypothetical protein
MPWNGSPLKVPPARHWTTAVRSSLTTPIRNCIEVREGGEELFEVLPDRFSTFEHADRHNISDIIGRTRRR